jgi:lysozyme
MKQEAIDRAVGMIQAFERLELVGYLCPAGVPTGGWGHTGPEVYVGMIITEEQADKWLEDDMIKAIKAIDLRVKVGLSINQSAALISFVFNVGVSSFRVSTFLRLLNMGDYVGAAAQMPRWVKATVNGKIVTLPGLVIRRAKERELFEKEAAA